jgi:hypothetical protein
MVSYRHVEPFLLGVRIERVQTNDCKGLTGSPSRKNCSNAKKISINRDFMLMIMSSDSRMRLKQDKKMRNVYPE